jgi:hypothetical protein
MTSAQTLEGCKKSKINNDRADKRQSPLPLPMYSVDLSGALLIRDDKIIIHRDI